MKRVSDISIMDIGQLFYRYLIFILAFLIIIVSVVDIEFNRNDIWGYLWVIIFVGLLFGMNRKQERFGYIFSSLLGIISVGIFGPDVSILGFLVGGGLALGVANSEHIIYRGTTNRLKSITVHWFEIANVIINIYLVDFLIINQNRVLGFTSDIDLLWLHALLLLVVFLVGTISLRTLYEYLNRDILQLRQPNSISIGVIISYLVSYVLVVLSYQLFPIYGVSVIISAGILVVLCSYFYESIFFAQWQINRKEKELLTLDRVSNFIQSSIVLDEILLVIKEQIFSLTQVDNFYVALFDDDRQELWYPLAVRNGRVRHWPRRHFMPKRLTDRVIQSGEAVLYTSGDSRDIEPEVIPPSEVDTTAWLGIPLITAKRTIGCLAIFGEPGDQVSFEDDQYLLTILSGQVSTAIENALLYEQVQKRADQLETLNKLTHSLSMSLQLDEVLDQVCNSVLKSGKASRSAIFLFDEQRKHLSLKKNSGLPVEIVQNESMLDEIEAARSVCSDSPRLVEDYRTEELHSDNAGLYLQGGIFAGADFPLSTPTGNIGYLSVYYDAPHHFREEEIEFLSTFASQAAISISNAMLHSQTDQELARRVQQLSILEEVSRELSAAVVSDRLYNIILDHAADYTQAPCGAVDIYEPDYGKLMVKASRGYSKAIDMIPDEAGIVFRIYKNPQVYNSGNVDLDSDFLDLWDGKTKSQITAPLVFEGKMLGLITLESDEPNAFSTQEEAFLSQLANQSAIAVQNATLYSELGRRLDDQSTLYDFSSSISRSLEQEELLSIVFDLFSREYHPRNVILLIYQPEVDEYTLAHSSDPVLDPSDYRKLAVDLGPVFTDAGDGLNYLLYSRSAKLVEEGSPGLQDNLIFQMATAGSVVGYILIEGVDTNPVTDDQVRLGSAMAVQGAIALQNSNLFQIITEDRDRVTSIINSIEEGVLMVDSEGRIVLCNQRLSDLVGMDIEVFKNWRLDELPFDARTALGIDDASAIINWSIETSVDKSIHARQYSLYDNIGVRHLEQKIGILQSDKQSISGLILVIRDITNQVELEEARELITTTLIHDLRSPMSAVIGSLDMLVDLMKATDPDDALIQQSIQIARRSTRRVVNLTEDLLDISGLSKGSLEINDETIEIRALFDELIEETLLAADEYGIDILIDLPSFMSGLVGDYRKVYRVFANILDNALKFTPDGGSIIIRGEEFDDVSQISISDTGPGVPEEFREKIFDEFAQVPGMAGRKRGTGLGLAFCKLAIEAHHGKIWVENGMNGGSRFVVQFPKSIRLQI